MTFPTDPPEGTEDGSPAGEPQVGEDRGGDDTGRELDDQAVHVEPVENELEQVPPVADAHASHDRGFTSGEKIRSLLELVFEHPHPDARARAALRAISTARRFGLLRPILDVFPPLDNEAAWDEWLALATGVCLNLASDGLELDVDELRHEGGLVLAALFADTEGEP